MTNERKNREVTPEEIIEQKLREAEIPGHEVEFDPDEADRIAFREGSLC
jgi:hypothetical protein